MKPDDQIKRFFAEVKSGNWLQNAQRRSERRKSAWNLLLPLFALPLWFGFTSLFVALTWLAHTIIHPEYAGSARQFFADSPGLSGGLMFLPPLVAAIFPALVVTNFLVYLIPAARRAMDNEDRDHPGTDYASSQRALIRAGAVAVAGALILALAGAALG